MTLIDRYRVEGTVVPDRVARFLDRSALDQLRRQVRGADREIDAVLMSLHEAGLRYADRTAADGRTPLPQEEPAAQSRHDLLDTAAAAERLGCERRNIRDLCQRGRILAQKRGREWWIAPEVLDGYLCQRAG